MNKKVLTLCFLHQSPRILLGMKKVRFGKGKWNGFGGHVEEGEAIEAAAIREMKEESGLLIEDLEKVGVIDFFYPSEAGHMEVHVFKGTRCSGELQETDEMAPRWFNEDEIPYELMWPDDKYWMPLLLAGKRFQGSFTFDDQFQLKDSKVNET